MSPTHSVQLAAVLLLGAVWLNGSEPRVEELRTARQIRELRPTAANESPQVELSGVVIGQAEPVGESFVLWDGTDSIYILGRFDEINALAPGDSVVVRGRVLAGDFAPILKADNVKKTGVAPLPEPVHVASEDLFTKGLDAQWIVVTGIVRDVRPAAEEEENVDLVPSPEIYEGQPPSSGRIMTLAIGDRLLPVEIFEDVNATHLVDAEVEIRGLCFNLHNSERQFLKPLILVPPGISIRIVRAPPAKPFEMPPVTSRSLFQFQREGSSTHRVGIKGTVLHYLPGTGLWIRDDDRGFFVHTVERIPVEPGDLVHVAGFPERGDFAPALAHAIFRKVGREAPPQPVPLRDATEAAGHHDDLVVIVGTLLDRMETAQGPVLRIRVLEKTVDIVCTGSNSDWSTIQVEPGSLLEVTGICLLSAEDAVPISGLLKPDKFSMLVRKPADIVKRRSGPLWTPRRLAVLLAVVASTLAVVLATVFTVSRRRLARERALRALKASEYAARLAERSRMARDIHDSVAQGLGAVSLQLQLAECGPLSDQQARHVGIARQIVSTSLTEVRGFIRDLRSQALQGGDLLSVLEEQLRHAVAGTKIRPVFECVGETHHWPLPVELQVIRIAQEAMANAVQHSEAGAISVRLRFTPQEMTVTVADDGTGFDPDIDWARRGHFGLLGMQERTALIGGATLQIDHPSGGGTRVRLTIPVGGQLAEGSPPP